jgi:hypothetical protein
MNIIRTAKPYYSLYDLILKEINPTEEEIKDGYLLHRDCGMKAHVISSKGNIPICNVSFEDLIVPSIKLAIKPISLYKDKDFDHIRDRAKDSLERLIDVEVFKLIGCAVNNENTIKAYIPHISDNCFNKLIGIIESHDLPPGTFVLNPLTYRAIESSLDIRDKHNPQKTYVGKYNNIPIYTSVMCQQNIIFLVAQKEYVGVLVNYGLEENKIIELTEPIEESKCGFEIIKSLGFAVVNDYAVTKIICT